MLNGSAKQFGAAKFDISMFNLSNPATFIFSNSANISFFLFFAAKFLCTQSTVFYTLHNSGFWFQTLAEFSRLGNVYHLKLRFFFVLFLDKMGFKRMDNGGLIILIYTHRFSLTLLSLRWKDQYAYFYNFTLD